MRRGWAAFAGCAWYGLGGLMTLLGMLTIGPLVLVVTMAVGIPMAIRLGDRLVAGWPGLGVGGGLGLLLIGGLWTRDGLAMAAPWLTAGGLAVAVSAVLFLVQHPATSR